MTETPDFLASFNVQCSFSNNDINTGLSLFTDIKQEDTSAQAYSISRPNQEDGGDTIEYATKMLGGESQLVNWVRVAGVDITHWIAGAMAVPKINKETGAKTDKNGAFRHGKIRISRPPAVFSNQ